MSNEIHIGDLLNKPHWDSSCVALSEGRVIYYGLNPGDSHEGVHVMWLSHSCRPGGMRSCAVHEVDNRRFE